MTSPLTCHVCFEDRADVWVPCVSGYPHHAVCVECFRMIPGNKCPFQCGLRYPERVLKEWSREFLEKNISFLCDSKELNKRIIAAAMDGYKTLKIPYSLKSRAAAGYFRLHGYTATNDDSYVIIGW